MTVRPQRTPSARVRLLVLSVLAVLVVGAVASAVLRERHMDKAEEAFLSDIGTGSLSLTSTPTPSTAVKASARVYSGTRPFTVR
jgi:hypothetical protein